MESLMIELYLHIKIYLDNFLGRLNNAKKLTSLTFLVSMPKLSEVIPKYLYSLLLHRIIYKPVSGFAI